MISRRLVALLGALVAGCMATPGVHVTTYDFGLDAPGSRSSIRLPGTLAIEPIHAPSWFDGSEIFYRLAYRDPTRRDAYSQSHWVGPPEELLAQRLRQKLDTAFEGGVADREGAVASDFLLRVELGEFSQVFDTPDSSRAVVRVRASLIDVKHRRLLAKKEFDAERTAPTPDAAGAVHGLRAAGDAALDALIDWLGAQLQ